MNIVDDRVKPRISSVKDAYEQLFSLARLLKNKDSLLPIIGFEHFCFTSDTLSSHCCDYFDSLSDPEFCREIIYKVDNIVNPSEPHVSIQIQLMPLAERLLLHKMFKINTAGLDISDIPF